MPNRRLFRLATLALAITAAAWLAAGPSQPATAADIRATQRVVIPVGTTIEDDLIVAAADIEILGNVTGDVIAAGQNITVSGNVGGSLNVAGTTIVLSGTTGGSVRAAGNAINFRGSAGRDLMAFGSQVTVEPTARVGGSAYLNSAATLMGGTIARNLDANGDTVTISGSVAGNVTGEIARLSLAPTARVGGNLTYTSSSDAQLAPGAQVAGSTTRTQPAPGNAGPSGGGPGGVAPTPRSAGDVAGNLLGEVIGRGIVFLMGLAVGAAFILLFPRATAAIDRTFRRRAGFSLLTGFLTFVVTPIVLLMLLVTIVGIPLAVIGAMILTVLWYLGVLVAALALARYAIIRFRPADGEPNDSRAGQLLAFLLGLFVLTLLTAVPFIGPVVGWVLMFFGLGAIVLTAITRDSVSPTPVA